MSKIEKVLRKWESKPVSVQKNEVLSILKRYCFELDFKRGSHIVVTHPALVNKPNFGPDGEFTIPVKSGRKVKGFYLKRILEAIAIIEEEE